MQDKQHKDRKLILLKMWQSSNIAKKF